MNKIFIVCCLFLFTLCTPQQRLKRLLKKHPELIKTQDTIIIDTIITRSFYYDSTLKANFFKDTIVIVKNNLTTKVFYNYKTDSLYLLNDLKPDTIIKTITIPAKVVQSKNKFEGLQFTLMLLVIILILLGLLKAIRKK